MVFDRTGGECAHAVHKVVPLRHADAQLLFHCTGIKACAVRHFDRLAGAVDGNRQGVIADHTNGGRRGGGG
ncbi:hypothetical protein D3C84_1184290 [compost metagenome]